MFLNALNFENNKKYKTWLFQLPGEVNFPNEDLKIVQFTAHGNNKLFRVASTHTDVFTSRMSPFTLKQNVTMGC